MPAQIQKKPGRAFLAFPGWEEMLREELRGRFGFSTPPFATTQPASDFMTSAGWYGQLLYLPTFEASENPYWARTTLLHPLLVTIESAGDAAKALMSMQRNWAPYLYQLWRRAELIQKKLPFVPMRVRSFPATFPTTPMGLYTLLDANHLLAGAETTSDLALGELKLEEDHTRPPSRAYLKLQEGLVHLHHHFGVPFPQPGERCFDAGACPGGWTWVLRQCGAEVFAVDRSPLHPALMRDPLVTFQAHDAFTLERTRLGAFDWIVSDVICYPERLLPWVRDWIQSDHVRRMVCTIKLQGAVDWDVIRAFAELPDSRVLHLNYNKHELTFLYARKENAL